MKNFNIIMKWAKDLFPICRSITGKGTLKTLSYLKNINPELKINSVASGRKFFDWKVPNEWNVSDAYILHLKSGKKFANFKKNNLYLVNYSHKINKLFNLNELKKKIHTDIKNPKNIPYITSYYKKDWGFCLSYNEFSKLPTGDYRVVIDSKLSPGRLHYGELLVKGISKKEILISTNICHPSLANNELSGPLLASYLIQSIKKNFTNNYYSYRFLFIPETIGSIIYIKKNLDHLKKNVIAGFVLSCVGDNRAYSIINSRRANTLSDLSLSTSLMNLKNVKEYSYLFRGSDERQYCSPGVDLPIVGFCRSKYVEYPEYHSSADNLSIISAKGFEGSYNVLFDIFSSFEIGLKPKTIIKCEPQLSKRGLYPTLSDKKNYSNMQVNLRMNLISYCDGDLNIFEISKIIGAPLKNIIEELKILKKNRIVKMYR